MKAETRIHKYLGTIFCYDWQLGNQTDSSSFQMSHDWLSHEDLALGQTEGMWESKVIKISSLSSQHCAVSETAMPKAQTIKITPPCSFPPPLNNRATTSTCAEFVSNSLWPYELQPIRLIGFFRQEYWGGLPCPPPGDLLNPRLNSCLLHWKADFFTTEPPVKPR